jgi:hypothetical protein
MLYWLQSRLREKEISDFVSFSTPTVFFSLSLCSTVLRRPLETKVQSREEIAPKVQRHRNRGVEYPNALGLTLANNANALFSQGLLFALASVTSLPWLPSSSQACT